MTMDIYLIIKTIHIISAAVLFGTGLGIAFFMLSSRFTDDAGQKFFAARFTVIADTVFTLPAVILQPTTGLWLVWQGGYDWSAPWLIATYILYAVAGLCWLPVVWIQIRIRHIAMIAAQSGTPLPPAYDRLFRIWFALGWPAFTALIAVFFLMVAKPA